MFAAHIRATKCDKTSYLNSFNIGFIPFLSYSMLATQFSEQHWSQIVLPAIAAILNAAGMVKNSFKQYSMD